MIFHEIGLHKPDFDETWYDHNYVTRRITACYSRYNDMFENNAFYKNTQLNEMVATCEMDLVRLGDVSCFVPSPFGRSLSSERGACGGAGVRVGGVCEMWVLNESVCGSWFYRCLLPWRASPQVSKVFSRQPSFRHSRCFQ